MFSRKFYWVLFMLLFPLVLLVDPEFITVIKTRVTGTEKELVLIDKTFSKSTYVCGKGKKTCEKVTHLFHFTDNALSLQTEVSFLAYDNYKIGDKVTVMQLNGAEPFSALKDYLSTSELFVYLVMLIGISFVALGHFFIKNQIVISHVYNKFLAKLTQK